MSFLSDASDWLADQLTTHASVSVTYSRSRTRSVTFDAIPGRPDGQRREPGQGRVRLDDERLDFHFRPELLDFGSGQVEPERGDRLEVNGLVREVAPGDGASCWSRSDAHGHMIRVRTQLEGAT